jgi:hypothetical protein
LFFPSALRCSNRFLILAKREGRVSSLEIQIQIATSILCSQRYLISEENASPDQAVAETSIFCIPKSIAFEEKRDFAALLLEEIPCH